MARFLADEDFSFRVVKALRAGGADGMTALEAGLANRGVADSLVLAKAVELDRCRLPHNRRDFLRLHRERNGQHAGMVLCPHHVDVAEMAESILRLTAGRECGGAVVRVNRGG